MGLAQGKESSLECGCCFEETVFRDLVQCTEGHVFCSSCLKRAVEMRLFGDGRTTVGCFSSEVGPGGETCGGVFRDEFLRRALPQASYNKYSEALAREEVHKAGLRDLVTCPFCDSMAELPRTYRSFTCPNPACGRSSCRWCREPGHGTLSCEEAKKKKQGQAQTEKRRMVEEAMTEARLRSCTKCGRRFVKEEGCNKVKCACGALMCYVCRAHIPASIGYAHFCRAPLCTHLTCGKCKLFTNDEEDDRRAMKEAGARAKDRATRDGVRLDNVDVDKLLEKKAQPNDKRLRAPGPVPIAAGPVNVPGVPPVGAAALPGRAARAGGAAAAAGPAAAGPREPGRPGAGRRRRGCAAGWYVGPMAMSAALVVVGAALVVVGQRQRR